MTTSIDPLSTAARVSTSYERYLSSILPVQDPRMRAALTAAIRDYGAVTKGPYLEASPPYAAGATIADLVEEGVLCQELLALTSDALPADRPLYRHQEQAIRKAAAGRSLVVATGTGSGKTESFLVPILDRLCREKAAGTLGPGVRALLLYPMNALANDQVKRLRSLLARYPDITFGRYTGETEEQDDKALELYRQVHDGREPLPNELISRRQMREAPPHILLTNFAMLEYLLLRPLDLELFEGEHAGHWQWLAVDEAHVYAGAQGSEVAMLLRRLRHRVTRDDTAFQTIATSATVGDDLEAVAQFASGLSASNVEYVSDQADRQDVVPATRRELPAAGVWSLADPGEFERLAAAADPEREIQELARASGWDEGTGGDPLASEEHVSRLRRLLASGGPATLADLVSNAELPGWTPAALTSCVRLASAAQDAYGSPVLSARYHLFAKAAEGAFACLGEAGPHVHLTRHHVCPDCQSQVFEIGCCRQCGHLHLVGSIEQIGSMDVFKPVTRSDLRANWLVLDPHSADGSTYSEVVDEDEEVGSAEQRATARDDIRHLCPSCGSLSARPNSCDDIACEGGPSRPVRVLGPRQDVRACGACGLRGQNAIRAFSTGNDAAAAVLATALYQELPAAEDETASLPGEGRKLLLFNDSRQSASFFAGYLETSYDRVRRRALILAALPEAYAAENGPVGFDDVASEVARLGVRHHLFPPRQSRQRREDAAALWTMQEILSVDRRISLEGLGMIDLRLDRDPNWQLPQPLRELGLTDDECWDLVEELAHTLRASGALTMPERVAADDEAFTPRRGPFYVRASGSDTRSKTLSWLPSAPGAINRRITYLRKVLSALGHDPAQAERFAEGIWTFLTQHMREGWLRPHTDRTTGVRWQLDHTWLQMAPLEPGTQILRCSACRHLTTRSVRRICPVTGCEGQLEDAQVLAGGVDVDHYRDLYRSVTPIGMRVVEHTAQWVSTKAAEIQQQFVIGDVNVLSCSTTFELGVDVGELQSVMMRNVPPKTANYLQRAGRAGRRTSSAAVVLTFAQRRPRDLARYAEPIDMMAGRVSVPHIHLDNDRIDRRHAHSIVLADFFRRRYRDAGRTWQHAGDFFLGDEAASEPPGVEELRTYLRDVPTDTLDAVRAVMPPLVTSLLDVDGGGFATHLGELVTEVRDRLRADVDEFEKLKSEAAAQEKFTDAERYKRIIKTLRGSQLLGHLAQHNVLPKYGFPVDTVEMRTVHTDAHSAADVQLGRDLATAIYEYAPGAQVVAGQVLWTSGGVQIMPGRALVERSFAVCDNCGHYAEGVDERAICPACDLPYGAGRSGTQGTLVEPRFGFVAKKRTARPGTTPPERAWNGRTYVRRMPTEGFARTISLPGGPLDLSGGPRGELVALSHGAQGLGFYICRDCGWGASVGTTRPSAGHQRPSTGRNCRSSVQRVHLAHRFETDILRLASDGWADDFLRSPSALYAILEGAARALDMERDDIDGSIYMAADGRPSIVLFDTVPGGAGNVLRISEQLSTVLTRALSVVQSCECGEETSCFVCLRSFRNENQHEALVRRDALTHLRGVLE